MAMAAVIDTVDKAYRIFVFNPQTIIVAKEFASGHYEWSWVILMLFAVLLWNIKCWSLFRDEREKSSQIVRAAAEGILHWCFSNAALFCTIELHKAVYQYFTEYVPVAESTDKTSIIRKAMVDALTKIHLINQKMSLVPHIRSPQVPFGIMVAASLLAISLAFLVKKPEPLNNVNHAGDNA